MSCWLLFSIRSFVWQLNSVGRLNLSGLGISCLGIACSKWLISNIYKWNGVDLAYQFSTVASPKSPSRMLLSLVRNMLGGFRSLCIILLPWRYLIPWQHSINHVHIWKTQTYLWCTFYNNGMTAGGFWTFMQAVVLCALPLEITADKAAQLFLPGLARLWTDHV